MCEGVQVVAITATRIDKTRTTTIRRPRTRVSRTQREVELITRSPDGPSQPHFKACHSGPRSDGTRSSPLERLTQHGTLHTQIRPRLNTRPFQAVRKRPATKGDAESSYGRLITAVLPSARKPEYSRCSPPTPALPLNEFVLLGNTRFGASSIHRSLPCPDPSVRDSPKPSISCRCFEATSSLLLPTIRYRSAWR